MYGKNALKKLKTPLSALFLGYAEFKKSLCCLALLCLIVSPLSTLHAADLSREQAIERALQDNGGGKVLSVNEEKHSDGSITYAVKVISNGRVKVHHITANP